MKKDEDEVWWAPAAGFVIVVFVLISIALIAAGGWDWYVSFLGKEGSGWAQAIGSVLAIIGAYQIGQAQIQSGRILEKSKRAHEKYHRLMVIDETLSRLSITLSSIKESMNAAEVPVFVFGEPLKSNLLESSKIIKSFDLFNCPAAGLIYYLSSIPFAVDNFSNIFGKYIEICNSQTRNDAPEKLSTLHNGFIITEHMVLHARKICSEQMELAQKEFGF